MSGAPDRDCEKFASPIATAPRDGRIFVGLNDLGYPRLVWGDERGFFDEENGDACDDLRWWGPVPELPSEPAIELH